jgi:hypothetical protein
MQSFDNICLNIFLDAHSQNRFNLLCVADIRLKVREFTGIPTTEFTDPAPFSL